HSRPQCRQRGRGLWRVSPMRGTVDRVGARQKGLAMGARQKGLAMTSKARPGLTARTAAVVVVAGFGLLGAAPSAQARLDCSFTGPPENVLKVTASGFDVTPVIRRRGDGI